MRTNSRTGTPNVRQLVIIPLCILLFASCITDFGEEPEYIQFGDLRVGQQSMYLRLHGFKYGEVTSNVYLPISDTLVVRVIGRDAIGFVFEDYLTAHSAKSLMKFDTARFTYHVSISLDTLRVIGSSHLFWSYYFGGWKAALRLSDLTTTRFSLLGWKISGDPHSGISTGYVLNPKVLNKVYSRANVYYNHFEYDNTLPPDPPPYYCGYGGATFIYSEAYGMIRSRFVGKPQWDQGVCWDLLLH